jgi:hypothetical protein
MIHGQKHLKNHSINIYTYLINYHNSAVDFRSCCRGTNLLLLAEVLLYAVLTHLVTTICNTIPSTEINQRKNKNYVTQTSLEELYNISLIPSPRVGKLELA